MAKDREHFEPWLDAVIAEGQALRPRSEGHYDLADVTRWRTSAEHLLVELTGKSSPYYERFTEFVERDASGYREYVEACVAIIEAVQSDLRSGRLQSFRLLVEAEVFADFIGMAEHILDHGYYGAAAALMGSILERGLRDIAEKGGVKVGATGDLPGLNMRLAKAGVYNALRQKEVHFFIDVRNKAAHGEFEQFSKDDVRKMIGGVQGLLAAHAS